MRQHSKIRTALQSIDLGANPQQLVEDGINQDKMKLYLDSGYKLHRGKVRDCLSKDDELLIYHSDRLSAFDKPIGLAPLKGVILSACSSYWFEIAKKHDLPVAKLEKLDSRTLKMERLEPIKAEVIVRQYLAGSILRDYQKGERIFCGARLPDGVENYGKLPEMIITPTSKADVYGHDENTTPHALIEDGIVSAEEWRIIENIAKDMFSIGQEICLKQGWILADTKYEFGRSKNGQIKLIDEIHTPDSSRFWVLESYKKLINCGQKPKMFDKEIIRSQLVKNGFEEHGSIPQIEQSMLNELSLHYLDLVESILGETLNH